MSGGGLGQVPHVIQRASDVIDVVRDAATGVWTPEQKEQGQQIADANRQTQQPGIRDSYRMGSSQ